MKYVISVAIAWYLLVGMDVLIRFASSDKGQMALRDSTETETIFFGVVCIFISPLLVGMKYLKRFLKHVAEEE